WLDAISSSFHGRDIFSPTAAHLAIGASFESVGRVVPAEELVRLTKPTFTVGDGRLATQIVHVMIYGNVTFAGTPADLEAAIGPLAPGRPVRLTFGDPELVEDTVWGVTFGSVPLGSSVLMSDAEGHLSFADNQGNAAWRLNLNVDRPVTITAR